MRGALGILPILLAASAHADSGAVRLTIAAMTAADADICSLLRSETKDGCKRLAKRAEPSFGAEVFQAGTARGIRRLVLVVTAGDQRMVGPSVDLLGETCDDAGCVTLQAATPTVRAVQIDGRPGVVLDVVSKFQRGSKTDTFQTEAIVGCAPVGPSSAVPPGHPLAAAGLWKCSSADLGQCEATVGPDGAVTTSCGTRANLTFAP